MASHAVLLEDAFCLPHRRQGLSIARADRLELSHNAVIAALGHDA